MHEGLPTCISLPSFEKFKYYLYLLYNISSLKDNPTNSFVLYQRISIKLMWKELTFRLIPNHKPNAEQSADYLFSIDAVNIAKDLRCSWGNACADVDSMKLYRYNTVYLINKDDCGFFVTVFLTIHWIK